MYFFGAFVFLTIAVLRKVRYSSNALREPMPNAQEHLMLLRKAILHFATFKAIVKATVQLLSQSRSQFGSMANPPDKLTPPSEF